MGSETCRRRASTAALLLVVGCTSGGDLATTPTDELPALSLEVLGQHSIRLQWTAAGTSIIRLERRVNLQGDFAEITGDLRRAQTSYVDDGLEPDTFYGYRLIGVDPFGDKTGVSPAVGGRTAPPSGIQLSLSTQPPAPPSVDADGYELTIAGPTDTVRQPVDVNTTLLLSPLAPGAYRLTLSGLAPQCAGADSLTRTATVTDQGTETVQQVAIAVQCRNPERGQATAVLTTSGELPDPDGFDVELAGLASDATLADSERVYLQRKQVGGPGGTVSFPDLRPGTYAFTVSGLAANCTVHGPQQVSFDVALLDDVQQAFSIDCPDPSAGSRPFALRPTWVPAAAPAGTAVALELVLDLTARASQAVAAFETQIHVPTGVLRYDSTAAADLPSVFANQPQPGLLLVSGFTTATAPMGQVKLARVWFTVVGGNGETAITQTTHSNTVGADGTTFLDPEIRTIEGTFTVGAGGGGGGGNQAPQAHANGPYSGTTGAAISFSAAGSTDLDGSIASYAWTFGDGASGTGASPTHSYAAAGSYTATLTVTDNLGLTASATAAVTVTDGGGGGGGGECGAGTSAQPFVLCSAWSPASAATGDQVLLTQAIDLTPDGAQDLVAFETTVLTDAALVRFDSARAGGITNLVVNGSTPGTVRLAGFVTGSGPKGVVTVAKVYYTVLASSGQTTTQTTFSNFVGTSGVILDSRITKAEGTLTIGSGTDTGGDPDDGTGGDAPGTSSLDWQTSFGPVDAAGMVPLNVTLDLRSDPALRLGGWQVTSLSWDPAVLSYATTDFAGGSGVVNATDALQGRLSLSGAPASGGGAGLVTVAIVRFIAYGAPGSSSSAAVTLGAITGLTSGGAIDLRPRVVIHDGSFITP
jgi:PKD repeat protein